MVNVPAFDQMLPGYWTMIILVILFVALAIGGPYLLALIIELLMSGGGGE